MELAESQQVLANTMSEISEFCWFAGWLDGTEYRLWQFMTDLNDNGAWGSRCIPDEARDELRRLSEITGGWICWSSEVNAISGEDGTSFVPREQWLSMFEDWRRKTPQRSELPRRYIDYSEWHALQINDKDQDED